MGYSFDWVAAFAEAPFGGNAAMVVYDAEGLDDATRLKIVRETSLVECVFLERSEHADIRFRIYLARREIPFAGHPTLAAAASLAQRGLIPAGRLVAETGAGLIPIEIDAQGRVVMQQVAPVFGPFVDPGLVADCLSLSQGEIIHPPQVVSTGLPFTVTLLRDADAMARAVLNADALARLQASIDMPDADVMEPFMVTLGGASALGDTYARLLVGPPYPAEDPFTGSATGAMASYLWHHGLIDAPDFVAEQGHGMGRPGQAHVQVLGPPDQITGVRLAGAAHVTMTGELHL